MYKSEHYGNPTEQTACKALCVCQGSMALFQISLIKAEDRQQASQGENKHRRDELGEARN